VGELVVDDELQRRIDTIRAAQTGCGRGDTGREMSCS